MKKLNIVCDIQIKLTFLFECHKGAKFCLVILASIENCIISVI